MSNTTKVTQNLLQKVAAQRIAQAQALQQAKQDLLGDLFQLQIDFILSPAKRKTLVAGRRSGKTFALARLLIKTALENDNRSLLIPFVYKTTSC